MELTLVLDNSGTAPADDVHVELSTKADGVWLEELPEAPAMPEVPRRQDPFDFAVRSPLLDFHPDLRQPDLHVEGPTITEAEPKRVEYWARRVTHNVPFELSAVHFQFNTDQSVASFGIDYRLVAANIPKPKHGTLHVKLSLAEPEPPPSPFAETQN